MNITNLLTKQNNLEDPKKLNLENTSDDFLLNDLVEYKYPFLSVKVKEIDKNITNMKIELSRREEILKKFLAISLAANDAEKSYRLIYGSQIMILLYLNIKDRQGEEIKNLEVYYKEFLNRSQLTKDDVSIESYISFLVIRNLVKYENPKFIISSEGKYFLSYILENKYPFDKPY